MKIVYKCFDSSLQDQRIKRTGFCREQTNAFQKEAKFLQFSPKIYLFISKLNVLNVFYWDGCPIQTRLIQNMYSSKKYLLVNWWILWAELWDLSLLIVAVLAPASVSWWATAISLSTLSDTLLSFFSSPSLDLTWQLPLILNGQSWGRGLPVASLLSLMSVRPSQ